MTENDRFVNDFHEFKKLSHRAEYADAWLLAVQYGMELQARAPHIVFTPEELEELATTCAFVRGTEIQRLGHENETLRSAHIKVGALQHATPENFGVEPDTEERSPH